MKLLSYIKGLKKGKDAHRIEKDAMRDAFLADALEGFETVPGDHIRQIEGLRQHIRRQSSPKARYGRLWSVAAGLLLLLSVGSYFLLIDKETPDSLLSHQFSTIDEDSLLGPPLLITHDLDESIRPKAPLKKSEQQQQQQQQQQQIPIEISVKPLQERKEQEKQTTRIRGIQSIPSKEPEGENIRIRGAKSISTKESAELAQAVEDLRSDTDKSLMIDLPDRMKVSALAEALPDTSQLNNTDKIARLLSGQLTLKGKVTDAFGEPIIGAAINIKGKSSGTVSDVDGTFRLPAKEGEILSVQFIGYDAVEIPVKSSNDLQIAMIESSQSLDEVVVVGYATRKKKDLTGAVTQIPAKSIHDKMPEPVNGMKAFEQYLKENLVRPTDEECMQAKGKVKLSFYVGSDGRPKQIVVEKGICPSADDEAVRLLKEGPDWTFGTKQRDITIKF